MTSQPSSEHRPGEMSPPVHPPGVADFSKTGTHLDSTRAAVVDGEFVVFASSDVFRPIESLSPAELRQLRIRQAALRLAAGLEARSLRELAREIGCNHNAIDRALARICERVGIHKFLATDATRAAQSEAQLRRRDSGAATETAEPAANTADLPPGRKSTPNGPLA